MKKFMTVLLVIAVMFTFSFSTAFAATKTAEDYVNDAFNTLSTELNAAYVAAVNAAADDTIATAVAYWEAGKGGVDQTVNVKFSAKAKAAAFAEEKNFFETVLATRKAEVLADAATLATITSHANAKTELEKVVATSTSKYFGLKVKDAAFAEYASASATWKVSLLKYALEEAKETAANHFAQLNLGLYPDTVMNADDPFAMTHLGFATQQQAEYLDDLDDITVSAEDIAAVSSGTGATYKPSAREIMAAKLAAVATIEGKLTADLTYGGVVYTYKFVGETYTVPGTSPAVTVALATKDSLTAADKADAVVRAAELAEAQSNAAAFKLAALNSPYSDAVKAQAVKEADAYLAVETVRIAEATTPSATAFTFAGYDLYKADAYVKVVEKYEALEDEAAAAKLAVGEAGTLMYVASIIDENLADAKEAIYGAATNAASLAVVVDITEGAKGAASLEWAKEVALAQLAYNEKVALRTDVYGTAKYYDVEAAKVAAAYDKLEAKVAACTTVEQVKAIPTSAVISSIPAKTAVVTKIQGLTKFAGELTKINTYLTAQNMLAGTTKITDDGYRAAISSEALAKFYAKSGARTNDEIVAALEAAKEWAMTTPTVKELKDEKVALEAQIEALAKLPTLADKEAVKAAYTANADRNCAAPKNEAKLTAAINIVKGLEAAEIDKLVKALPAKITAADKAAVKAISDAITAYNAEKMYNDTYAYTGFTLATAKTAVRNSELAALEAAIAKIPANATAAEVEAVRAMYDAYVAEYTSALYNDDASEDVNNIFRLVYAEKVVAAEKAEAEADAKAAAIADIEGLKIKANSSAKKGSITVKWTVSEEVEGVKYQVYKSTKAQKGYKKAITTSKTSFKNTKNLTKGTRYFYKVRAIAEIDGVTYYSDWSNKANRIAK